MSITIAELQESLASISIPGVRRVYTSASAKKELFARDLPALLPDPVRPVETITSQRITLAGSWKRDLILNYVCLVAEVGAGRGPHDYAERTSQLAERIQNAICDWKPQGAHYITSVITADMGLLSDAVGAALDPSRARQFSGFTLTIHVGTSY